MDERARPSQLTGRVAARPFAQGSKSAHTAVVLETDDGKSWVLRRMGGNAFRDEALDKLVGKRIRADGRLAEHSFLMTSWKELPDEDAPPGRAAERGAGEG